jgi:hypothetical protein
VHDRTGRDLLKRQCVTRLDIGIHAGRHHVADRKLLRAKNVALLAVSVVQERDTCRPVGVVLDRRDLGGNAVLVTLEVNDAVAALVATTLVTRSDSTIVVAATVLRQRLKQ